MQGLLRNVNAQSDSPGPSGPPGNDAVGVGANGFAQLRSDDVGYFDPSIEGEGAIVIVKRHIFYKNVYVFVNRLKNVVGNKNNASAIRGVRLRELIVAQGAQGRCALFIALVRIPQP